MKRILFPTDFSDAANNALNIAIILAKSLDAELHILHSLNSVQQYVDISLTTAGDITMPGMQPEVVLAAIQQETDRVNGKMKALENELISTGITIKTEVIQQALDFEINEIIHDNKIDFVVMGTHGSTGVKEAFIGSTAQKIVRIAKVPVLTVNVSSEAFKIEKIVCCSDFTEEQINEQIPRVKRFADIFNAKLDLVYINTPTYFEETKTVLDRIAQVKIDFALDDCDAHIYNAFDIDEGIINFASEQNADVISMITHGYRGVKKLFSDNVTESVVNHSEIPVLTLHIH
jgi:nucleotide-binding universal stress UspA family protein